MLNLNSKLLGGAAVALLAVTFTAPAQAASPLYAGGSTLAEKIYRDVFNCYGNQSGGDLTFGLPTAAQGCNGVTPYNANIEAFYVGVGSGNGKKAFVAHDATQFTSGARTPDAVPVASSTDFGPFYGTGAGSTWVPGLAPAYTKVSFIGSDDPLTTTDISTYNTNSNGWGAPIQVPAMISVITVPFNPSADWNPQGIITTVIGANSNVNLTTDTLCGIFTGAITDWNDNAFKAGNNNQNLATASHPINVVYRNDGSGTTFLFANALIHQCASTSHPVPASWQTAPGNASGVSNNNWFINVNTAGLLPGNFTGAKGSGGIKTAVTGTAGSISYISPDFTNPIDSTGPHTANLQIWTTVGHTFKFIAPTAVNGTATVGTAKAPSTKVDPINCPTGTGFGQSPDNVCAHNPLNFGQTFPTPTSSKAYPIGGFTFIDTYTCYASSTDSTGLAGTTAGHLGLLRWFFGSTTDNSLHVKTELTNNGFSLIPNSWVGVVKKILTSDQKTKIGTVGQLKTGCSTVSGSGA